MRRISLPGRSVEIPSLALYEETDTVAYHILPWAASTSIPRCHSMPFHIKPIHYISCRHLTTLHFSRPFHLDQPHCMSSRQYTPVHYSRQRAAQRSLSRRRSGYHARPFPDTTRNHATSEHCITCAPVSLHITSLHLLRQSSPQQLMPLLAGTAPHVLASRFLPAGHLNSFLPVSSSH